MLWIFDGNVATAHGRSTEFHRADRRNNGATPWPAAYWSRRVEPVADQPDGYARAASPLSATDDETDDETCCGPAILNRPWRQGRRWLATRAEGRAEAARQRQQHTDHDAAPDQPNHRAERPNTSSLHRIPFPRREPLALGIGGALAYPERRSRR
jgi:hypothetical protein